METMAEYQLRLRAEKQEYLKVQIIDKGYNTVDFAQYLLENRGRLLLH
jgi:hypothetical protein